MPRLRLGFGFGLGLRLGAASLQLHTVYVAQAQLAVARNLHKFAHYVQKSHLFLVFFLSLSHSHLTLPPAAAAPPTTLSA